MRLRIGRLSFIPTFGWGPCSSQLLVLLAAFHTGTVAASAQTVIATKAPPQSTVEFVLDSVTVGSGTADASGTVTMTAKQPSGKPEMDAHIYVDTCADKRRVLVVDRNLQPLSQDAGCQRSQVAGLFLVRPVSTLVVSVEGPTPTVLLRQGRFTPRAPGPRRTWSPSATGLVVFGGAGLATISDPVARACGDIADCSGHGSGLDLVAGAAFWFNRILAAEVSYMKPDEVTAEGREGSFRFNSSLDADVVIVGGNVGIPIGPVRLYGKGGGTYHQATFATTQTSDDVTVTSGDVTTTIEGGTQTFELKTAGWGWMFGGGIEVWVKPSFALYAEGGRATLKGSALDDADGALDDRLSYVVLGARVRIGR